MNIKTTKSFHSPIFITGVPRSGTSMTAGILAELGVFTGATVPPGVSNPKGFFENVEIRESVLKGILKASHFCPLGVKSLPPEDFIGKFNFGDGKSLKDILNHSYQTRVLGKSNMVIQRPKAIPCLAHF